MTLLLDIGNTRVKWRYPTVSGELHRGAGEHRGRALPENLTAASRSWPRPARVVAGSVAGSRLETLTVAWVRQLWDLDVEMVEVTTERCGVTCGYEDPSQLGIDRWLALIGARARVRTSLLVVDCGTAITVDAVSARGRHLGGAILPGIRLMRTALTAHTGRLPVVAGAVEGEGLGRSTRACMLLGTQVAAASAVNGLRARAEAELGEAPRCFLTGGEAGGIQPYLEGRYLFVPELVLDGLDAVARERSAGGARAGKR